MLGWAGLGAFALVYVIGMVWGMRTWWARRSPGVAILYLCLLAAAATTLPALGLVDRVVPAVHRLLCGLRAARPVALGTLLASIVAVMLGHFVFAPEQVALAIVLVVIVLGAFNTFNVVLISRSVRAERLRLDLATSLEREAVARDVHDLIGHTLTVVKLKAELASKLVDRDPERTRAELAAISELASEAISGVRSTVTGLRASSLEDQLTASTTALESSGMTVRVEGATSQLSTVQTLPASWVLREATTNILRHSRASKVAIAFAPGTVAIEDDGRGRRRAAGNGMAGMTERAAAAGAELVVEDVEGGGTRVLLRW